MHAERAATSNAGGRARSGAAAALAVAAALLAGGCGYALAGRGVSVDPSIKRVGVPLFRDRTGKPGLDQKITQKVTDELLKRRRFAVVPDATGVDALIDAELTAYSVVPIGFGEGSATAASQATRYAITVTARVSYAKTGVEPALWSNDHFVFREEYDLGSAETFFDREEQAIERLAGSFARSLVSAMLEAF